MMTQSCLCVCERVCVRLCVFVCEGDDGREDLSAMASHTLVCLWNFSYSRGAFEAFSHVNTHPLLVTVSRKYYHGGAVVLR